VNELFYVIGLTWWYTLLWMDMSSYDKTINVWLSGLMPRGIIVHTNSMMLTIWIF